MSIYLLCVPDIPLPKGERVNPSRKSNGERSIWQRRFWEHLIRDELDFQNHVDYIHYNPVKHGYVDRPRDWVYSSIHRYIERDIISKDWACGVAGLTGGEFGER